MARTKASVGAKVSSGKSNKARCSAAPPSNSSSGSGGSERSSKSSGGGNPVCPRETPKWQRPISTFFVTKPNQKAESGEESAGTSKPKPKPRRNIIESDDDEETPKNQELDETLELEPLTGENSHKLEEFYPKNTDKGKGFGKKTKNKDTEKENVDLNIDEDESDKGNANNNNEKSKKRERDDSFEESVTKKVKV